MPYGLGPSLNSITYFRQAGVLEDVPPPKGLLVEGSEVAPTAGGGSRWLGHPYILWRWGYLEASWYDSLHLICPNVSGTIFLESTTNDNEDEFQVFEAVYNWPMELDKELLKTRMGFELLFKRAIERVQLVSLDSALLLASGGIAYVVPVMLSIAVLGVTPRSFDVVPIDVDRAQMSITARTIVVVRS